MRAGGQSFLSPSPLPTDTLTEYGHCTQHNQIMPWWGVEPHTSQLTVRHANHAYYNSLLNVVFDKLQFASTFFTTNLYQFHKMQSNNIKLSNIHSFIQVCRCLITLCHKEE